MRPASRPPGARWAAPVLRVLAAVGLALAATGTALGTGAGAAGAASPAGASGRPATSRPVPSAGCARPPQGELSGATETLAVGGATRSYLLFTPPPAPAASSAARRPMPLVLDIHGLGEGDQIHAVTTRFGQLGQKDRFVVAFPQGTGSPVQWDVSATSHPNADLAFYQALLAHLEATYCIDTSRVYASGLSDGAFMVSLLACAMSTTFAAVAAVSGLVVPSPCHPARRMPIVAFHGTADPILYFNGGIGTGVLNHALNGGPAVTTTTVVPKLFGPGYPAHVAEWAHKDGCNPHPTDTRLHPHVILRTYRCPKGVAVDFYIILGGGHAWPGSAFSEKIASITGPTTFEIDGTQVIWQFFRRFALPAQR